MRPLPAPTVPTPVMCHAWRWTSFLHWRYPAQEVQSLLPAGLDVETFDGSAWVGLVPFLMDDVRPPVLPALPWLSRFPETNVRTYVRGPDGGSAIWFFSLDAARLPAVLAGRAGYGLRYFWSDMSFRREGSRLSYRCRRRWPAPIGARADIDLDIGAPIQDAELDPLTLFLTARHRLYAVILGRLAGANAEHPPWPLHEASLVRRDETLIRSAGLSSPPGEPLVHVSPGVTVRIGMWKWIQ
ncbi:MAG: DUF2071 domain-containing protein [Actinomycetota bacterium]|nr:DUF2071 domain-containing protein [Actinomycetota bacterium]